MLMKFYRNASIKNKLIVAFGVMIALILAVSTVSLVTQMQAGNAVNELREVSTNVTDASLQARLLLLDAHATQKNYLLYYNEIGITEANRRYAAPVADNLRAVRTLLNDLRGSNITTSSEIDQILRSIDAYEEAFDNARDLLEERGTGDESNGLFGELFTSRDTLIDFARDNGYYEATNMAISKRIVEQLEFEGVHFMDVSVEDADLWMELVEGFAIEKPETIDVDVHREYLRLWQAYYDDAESMVRVEQQFNVNQAIYIEEMDTLLPWFVELAAEGQAEETRLDESLRRTMRDATITVLPTAALAVAFGVWVALALSHGIASAVTIVGNAARRISIGDLDQDVTMSGLVSTAQNSNDELGQMALAFSEMIDYQQDVTRVAKEIAAGNLEVSIDSKSEYDVLGQSLQTMITNIRTVTQENEGRVWQSTGLTTLNNTMQGEQDIPTLSDNVITQLCEYLGALVGALYVREDDHLKLVGTYAYVRRKNLANEFKIGEGLVGQAALEKKPIVVSQVPEDYVAVTSGLGEHSPRAIMVCPFVHEGEVKGVIELGTLENLSDTALEFVGSSMNNIAIAFNTAYARTRMNTLLQQSQEQTEELRAQEEELRVTNEELQSQTETLRQSEAKLQEQQAALEASNAELEEKASALEESSQALRNQQSELNRQNDELKLAQGELERKAEELALTSKYKSEFLANMSHELRTPLNSLLILARMLADNKEGNLNDEQVESASIIYNGGNDLLSLINEILDLSKVEAGKMHFEFAPVTINKFATDINQQFRHMAQDRNLDFAVNVSEDVPESFTTDPQRLNQIIKNLLSNALKFTEQGGVSLDVTTPQTVPAVMGNQHAIAFSVRDSGIGMTPEQQKIVFEAFQQADGSTSRKYGGTGLGLSISRELATKLGGIITLDSQVGQGSTFTLYLPTDPPKATTTEHAPSGAELLSSLGQHSPSPRPLAPNAAGTSTSTSTSTSTDTSPYSHASASTTPKQCCYKQCRYKQCHPQQCCYKQCHPQQCCCCRTTVPTAACGNPPTPA